MPSRILILPGLYDSGPEHWQSIWETAHPDYRRVSLGDWGKPRCDDWIVRLDQAVVEVGPDVILVAHSSACALVGHWWIRRRKVIRAALLVAPSDTEASSYPVGPNGFAPMPLCQLPFPTIVVASQNDPAVSFKRARLFAESWGSEFVDAGFSGHIEAKSGFGPWPKGHLLLERLLQPPRDHSLCG
jgi:uncharacterized protein